MEVPYHNEADNRAILFGRFGILGVHFLRAVGVPGFIERYYLPAVELAAPIDLNKGLILSVNHSPRISSAPVFLPCATAAKAATMQTMKRNIFLMAKLLILE
jgi:hypothetical protein